MELTFDENKHQYKVDGVLIPSVTQIIKEAGLIDLSFVDEDLLEYKSDIGTKVHLTTELYDLSELDEKSLHHTLAGYLKSWVKFREDYQFVPTQIELMLYHRVYNYAGKIDRIGTLSGKTICQLDIKTGITHHSHALQSAGYTELFNYDKLPKNQIKKRLTVYLKDDGTYKVAEHKKTLDRTVFIAALTITNYKRSKK